jgi:hypothetical protein
MCVRSALLILLSNYCIANRMLKTNIYILFTVKGS